jgi:hypothetical protein
MEAAESARFSRCIATMQDVARQGLYFIGESLFHLLR